MMRYSLLVIGAVALAAVAANPPKLGPEWTYDKEMKEYFKMTPIKVTRTVAVGRGGQNYHLDLQHDKVVIGDTDGNIATDVWINGTMFLNIRKDPKSGPNRISFGVVNKYSYHDLNGDGVWDAWSDSRGNSSKSFIWYDGKWVPVRDSKGRYGEGSEGSFDRKTEYVWTGKAWKKRPTK